MKILYLHNHGTFGGASRSLYEFIIRLSDVGVEPIIVTQKGSTSEILGKLNKSKIISTTGITTFNHAKYGYYYFTRWFILIRELFYLPFTISTIRSLFENNPDIQLIHINEINNLPSLLILKKYFKKVPVVMHVRSVQQTDKGKLRRKIFRHYLKHLVDKIIAIDNDVYSSLPYKKNVEIIPNGLNIDNDKVVDNKKNKVTKYNKERPLRVLFIGNMLKTKGILELVQSAKYFKNNNFSIIFTVLGPCDAATGWLNRLIVKVKQLFRLNTSIATEIKDYVSQNALDNVIFTGYQTDIISSIVHNDIICFPSHLDAVGRPVIEGALLKKPSIVALADSRSDIIIENKTALVCKPQDVNSLIDKIKLFYHEPNKVYSMGNAAYELARKNFDISVNATKIYNLYCKLIEQNKDTKCK